MASESDFELFTSLRYDPLLLNASWNSSSKGASPFFLLAYHLDRLVDAANHFQWPKAIQVFAGKTEAESLDLLENLCRQCAQSNSNGKEPLRIRIVLSRTGKLYTQAFPTRPFPPDHDFLRSSNFNPDEHSTLLSPPPAGQVCVYLDNHPTPSTDYTSYKTTHRAHYEAAQSRFHVTPSLSPSVEVLLYNTSNEITEGTIRNVAFWREGKWVTPRAETGCLKGTVRRWLLEHGEGRFVEGVVMRDDVKLGERVLVFNGVEGVKVGVVENYRGEQGDE